MRRAAVSIPSNLAEGFNRFHKKDFRKFLFNALGSCAELETQIEIAINLKILSKPKRDVLIEKLDHESRMIKSLAKKIVV
jgi:four helix bundle protein